MSPRDGRSAPSRRAASANRVSAGKVHSAAASQWAAASSATPSTGAKQIEDAYDVFANQRDGVIKAAITP
jgi:hypothetical protein